MCCTCGVVFGMPDHMLRARRKDGDWFYCPSGHKQHFAESEADRLRKQLKHAEADRDFARTARDAWRDQADAAERSRRALRGVITRERRRTAAGVCPVDGCHRNFSNLGAHMDTEHPDYETDGARIDTGVSL
jgi:hypothetical protein